MLQGVKKFTSYSTTHCFMQCAVYTFSLHSIHSTVGHMEKELQSKTPPTLPHNTHSVGIGVISIGNGSTKQWDN